MSHFSVLVCTDDNTSVDGLLEPFDENKTVEKYISQTKKEFIDTEREHLKKYYSNYYLKYLEDKEKYEEENKDNKGHLIYISEIFPKVYAMTDEELYDYLIGEYEYDLDTEGNILSTYNPLSKWDWYVEGGRFSGLLKLKETGKCVDSANAQDVDFSLDEESFTDAIRFWEVCIEGQEPLTDREREYRLIYKKEYFIDRYGTKEEYARRMGSFSTWAVLTPDGKWHEPGQMGWFGCSSASEEDEKKFFKEYPKFIEEAVKNNWCLTVVDCHI